MAELKEKIFNEEMNEAVVHENLRWFLATRRRGTHSAKTRTEVSGGGKKPWKQKGTGRARAGSNRSPLWRKGGVIFPPKPRDYSYALPKKVRQLGIRIALSDFNREGKIKLVEGFSLSEPKTKSGVKFLKEAGVSGKLLVIMAEKNDNFEKGLRNITGVKIILSKDLNIFDLLKSEIILIEKKAVKQLEERIG
jgi:large subunit ribosomal protein L4